MAKKSKKAKSKPKTTEDPILLTPNQEVELNDRAASEENFEQKMAFETYFKAGDIRSLSRLAKEIGKAKSTLELWSSKFRWQSRVAEREKAAAEYMLIQDNAKKNAAIRKNHLTIIDGTIAMWVKKLKEGQVQLKGVDDLQRLLKLRWDIHGIPEQQVNPTHARSEGGASIDLRLRNMDRQELNQFLYSTLKSIERVMTNTPDDRIKNITHTTKATPPKAKQQTIVEPTQEKKMSLDISLREEDSNTKPTDDDFGLIDLDEDLVVD